MRSFLILISLATACGSSSTGDDVDASLDPMLRYEPWSTGAVWSYRLTDPSGAIPAATNKLTTVMAPRDVGGAHAGTTAYLVHIEQLVGSKDVYEAFSGALDVRYQSLFYDSGGALTKTDVDQPYRLKLDESAAHTVAGAQWSVTFTETSTAPGSSPQTSTKTEQWRVVSTNEQLTVIAGTYTALHVQRTSSGGSVQDYWYARGVGKLKETGGGQNEELMSYTPGQ